MHKSIELMYVYLFLARLFEGRTLIGRDAAMGFLESVRAKKDNWLERLALRPTERDSGERGEEGIELSGFGRGPERYTMSHPDMLLERYYGEGRGGKFHRLMRRMRPNEEQRTILVLLAVQTLLIIICYQFGLTRMLIYPFALISTIFHEFGHAAVCVATGCRVSNIEIRMDESGLTRFRGGWPCLILPAGYLGSSLIGALLLFMAFGHCTAKYTAIFVAFILISTIYWAGTTFTAISALGLFALMIAAYFYHDGDYTRHFILFLGAIASWQSILNILYTTVFHTIEDSDAYQFALRCSILIPAFVYGLLWFLLSLLLIASSICLALFVFKK